MDVCEVCGRPSRYLFAFPSTMREGVGVVYDGAPVCSPACAQTLREQRTQAPDGEGADTASPATRPASSHAPWRTRGELAAIKRRWRILSREPRRELHREPEAPPDGEA